ncbi:sensor histidine kinase [Vibrio cholerae]|nr:sensor histidine kinase [Vibrio cholerae]
MLSAGADDIIAKPIAEHELDMALEQHSERLYQFHRECKNICVSGILNLLKGNTECQYQTNLSISF